MSVRDLHNYNFPPVGVSNTNLTITALQLEACRPVRAGGNTFRAFCPFHGSDHQRSLRVNGDTGHFNCFACGAWGYTEEARERWKEQRQNQPNNPKTNTAKTAYSQNKIQSRPMAPPHPNLSKPSSPIPQPALRVVDFVPPPIVKRETTSGSHYLLNMLERYQAALPGSWGEEYLRRRKIPLELAQLYGVGYAPPGEWVHTARDWKFGRLVFPHTGPNGHILNLYGRAVGSNEKVPKTLRHDHLQGEKGYFNATVLTETPFLGSDACQETQSFLKVVRPDGQSSDNWTNMIRAKLVRPDGQNAGTFEPDEPVFVCEGPFDAISLIAAGKRRAVAIFGVNGWRWEWTRGVRNLVFALDADETGQKSWRDLARQARLRGKGVAFLPLEAYGEAKDVNEAWINGTLATYLGTNVTGDNPTAEMVNSEIKTNEPEKTGLTGTQSTFPEGITAEAMNGESLPGYPPAASPVVVEQNLPPLMAPSFSPQPLPQQTFLSMPASPQPVLKDPRWDDPRPELYKDSWLWQALFRTCLEGPEAFLYGSLHGLRCCGMRLRLSEGGLLKLGPSAELNSEESLELEQNFLESHGRNLDKLLKRMVDKFKPVD